MNTPTPLISLSLLVWAPIVAGIVVFLMRRAVGGEIARLLARVTAIAMLLGAINLAWVFDGNTAAMQFVEVRQWLPTFNIRYALGADGLSMLFVLLNALITFVAVMLCKPDTDNALVAALLITSGLTVGAFTALDGALFYVFFEAMLIPVYLLIGIFGDEQRRFATTKFFLFTLFGSLFMLLALFALYGMSESFSIATWQVMPISENLQLLLFAFFFLAFAVKTPMFPLHGWAPDAYSQGPAAAIVMLASTKIGAYAILRLMLPIAPDAARMLAPLMIALSLFAIIYFALVARAQTDMKRLIAYSSVAHMGMVTLGFFVFDITAMRGAVLLMVANALVAAALFASAGMLSARSGSRKIADYQGLAATMPVFATLFVFFAMANVGLPGTSGFVGELLVILGVVNVNLAIGLLAATVLVLAAFYTLWLVRRVVFGAPTEKPLAVLRDLNGQEKLVLFVLAAVMLGIGIYPQPLLGMIDVSVTQLLEHVLQPKI